MDEFNDGFNDPLGMDQHNYGGLGWENKEYLDISTFVLHILYFCCIYGMTVN